MRVSTQFPIAVHALMLIAHHSDRRVTSEMIAESAGCNAVIVRNIFKKLRNAELINTSSGKGVTTLKKSLDDISLWDIYTAVETSETSEIFPMHPNASGTCPVGSRLQELLTGHLDDAVCALKKEMSKVNLAMLAEELQRIQTG